MEMFTTRISRRAAFKTGALAAATALLPTGIAEAADNATKPESSSTRVAATPFSSYSKPVVEIDSGKVRGYISNGVNTFKGIPYGASTGGERRFLAPVKPAPWSGIRNCLIYGHACPPVRFSTGDGISASAAEEDGYLLYRIAGSQGYSENCLLLNVWAPGTDSRKRPVMVYMHGGGYSGGCSNDLLSYDGENLAKRHDVVVITHNHRLNLFGFLNLAEYGEKYAASGNVGMLDQVLMLEWVRNNVSSFGGDPQNVTIFGQSGGGGKVSTLMAMPAAKGLFHKVIVESGALNAVKKPDSELAAGVLQALAISPGNIDDIQTVPTERLGAATFAAMTEIQRKTGKPANSSFAPIADGKNIPVGSWDKEAPALSANIPMIIGTNLNEGVNGVDNPARDMDEATLMNRLSKAYGDQAEKIAAAYRMEHRKETPFGIWAAVSASDMRRGAIAQLEKKVALQAAPVYNYVYGWRTPALDGKPGTFHSAEISMVFDNADLCVNYSCGSKEGVALSANMSRAWTAFARTGNPNHPGIPHWPAYDVKSPSTMFFDSPSAVRSDFEGPGLRLLAQFPTPA
jgi:para-nitrobenzyl esterase